MNKKKVIKEVSEIEEKIKNFKITEQELKNIILEALYDPIKESVDSTLEEFKLSDYEDEERFFDSIKEGGSVKDEITEFLGESLCYNDLENLTQEVFIGVAEYIKKRI